MYPPPWSTYDELIGHASKSPPLALVVEGFGLMGFRLGNDCFMSLQQFSNLRHATSKEGL